MHLKHTRLATLVSALACSGLVAAEPTRWIVLFDEPPAATFESVDQLPARAKAAALRPTAPSASGKRRLEVADPHVQRYRRYLADRHDEQLARMAKAIGQPVVADARWDLVANGVAVRLDEAGAAKVRALPGVASVTPEGHERLMTGISTRYVGAPDLWNGLVPGFAATRGEGVVVGVLDSGINTAHPSFADLSPDGYNHANPRGVRYGLCAGGADARCNDKLIGIHDFVNEDGATGASAGKDLDGHGTHVASTVAGNPLPVTLSGTGWQVATTVTGVAPRANIIAYKVCEVGEGDRTSCPVAAIISGLNQAIADGVDVINYSIGGTPQQPPWSDSSQISQAFLNLRNAGIVGVAAAGNHSASESPAVTRPADAPWVLGVANTSSNAQFTTVLGNINGTGITTPFDLAGSALSGGVAEAELVYAGDFGNALCGTGTSQGTTPTGATNPFPPGTFTGKIVVCDRGVYARVEKGFNVRQSGAVGYVLANTSADGNSVVADQHFLPTVHLGFTDGDRLKTAIRTARNAGGTVRARIDGVQLSTQGRGSVLNTSSNVGPVSTYSGVLKPDLAAPGTDILAAQIPDANSIGSLTGTSMASPHVAGAAALMLAANPSWTVDQVFSALLTTATRNIVRSDLSAALFFEGGAGQLDIPDAVRSGLHLRVTNAEFLAANPANGGDPTTLNLPSLHTRPCAPNCTFTRTVTANVGGTWSASASMALGIAQVQPATLQLAQGQSAAITITVTPPASGGGWIEGAVRLANTSTPTLVSATELPISVFAPTQFASQVVTVDNVGAQGTGTLNIAPGVALDEVVVRDAELKPFTFSPINVGVDPAPADPYDNTLHNHVRLVTRPPVAPGVDGTRSAIYVETDSNNAQDLDLYVGVDRNGDGIPQLGEEICRGVSPGAREQCLVRGDFTVATAQYWIMVQNFAASGQANDQPVIAVYHGLLDGGPDLQFSAQAQRGRLASGQHVPVAISWNMPAFAPGSAAMAVVAYGSSRETPDNLGLLPVLLKRSGAADLPGMVMKARTSVDSRTFTLQPGQAHERIIVDVPPNATTLIARTSAVGGNVDLYLSKVASLGAGPAIPTAPPRAQQPFRSLSAGNDEVVAIEGAALTPGRYHVTVVNAGAAASAVTLSLNIEASGATVQPAANGYFNPARSGHGVFLAKTPQVWALAWYTFDTAGKPVWYTAQGAAAAPNHGLWSAPIYRSTWNGVRDNPQQVGEVILTFDGTGSFTYSWFLDGQYGSEPFQPIGAPVCANGNFSVGGGWLRPDQSGWGSYFLNFGGNFEAEAIYVYDQDGLPRWVIGDGTYATSLTKNLFQVSGFCPTCALVATTRTQVGTASRTLANTTTGTFSSNITFADGLTGSWVQNNVNWVKLTPDLACP